MEAELNNELLNSDLIELLKNIHSNNSLNFYKITSNKKNKIQFQCQASDCNRDDESSYTRRLINDIEWTTNRKANFLKRYNRVFDFEIIVDDIKDKKRKPPKGKILRFEAETNSYSNVPLSWLVLYILHNNEKLKKYGVNVKKNSIYIDDVEVAKIIKYKPEYDRNNNYKDVCAIYDLLVDDVGTLFNEKIIKIVNDLLEKQGTTLKCKYVNLKYNYINLYFDNDMSSRFYIMNMFDEKDLYNLRIVGKY
jgi:hypothetical protein